MKGSEHVFGVVALCLVGLWLSPPAQATVVLASDIEDLVVKAPVVVVGEVNQIESAWNEAHTTIHTTVTVTPSEVLKGAELLRGGAVVVKTAGGRVGDTEAVLDGAPRFELGERVLLFLEPRDDGQGFLTLGFFQGKYRVFKDPQSGRELLLRDSPARGVQVIEPASARAAEGKLRSLDEVRALCQAGGGR